MDVTTQSMLDGLALPPEEIIPENVHEKRTFTLRNLKEMPMFGYGCGVRATFREEVAQFAYESCGVRLFDTSSQYGTEDGIRRALFDSGLVKDRRDVFITATLDQANFYRVSQSLEDSLNNLGTDYVDLYLMNWPDVGGGNDNVEGRNRIWRQLEELYQDGVCKAIGVGNFYAKHLRPLISECRVYPHVLQVEMHPLNYDKFLLHYCRENGIQVQAHTPFANGGILDQPTVRRVAALYGRPSSQILTRWSLERKVAVVAGAQRRTQLAENCRLWDFTLSKTDMAALNSCNNYVFASRDSRNVP